MYEIHIIATCILIVLYFIASFLAIRELQSLVNILFASSTFTLTLANVFGLLGYLAADGYFIADFQMLWELGTIFLALSPAGFFYSAKVINNGVHAFTQVSSLVYAIFTAFTVLGIFLLYPLQTELQNIAMFDPILGLLLFSSTLEFYRLYKYQPEWANKITLIIVGFFIAILGLNLNFLVILSTGTSIPLLRHVPPLIGLTLVISAFIVIPESQRKISGWAELSILNTEMELLLDLLTHDLANQLTSTQGFLDLSLKQSNIKEFKDYIIKAKTGSTRSINLVRTVSILMKSKMDQNHQLKPISLRNAIDETKEILNDLYPRKNIKIKEIGISGTDKVLADSLFIHLLLNLLTNAVKSDDNEIINIEIQKTTTAPNKINLSVIDHGIGIPPEKREGIFDKYTHFRQEGITSSGLGLHIVQTLIGIYNGSIQITNTLPSDWTQGTTITLELNSHN